MRRSVGLLVGVAVLLLWGLAALLAPWLAPYGPTDIDFAAAMDPRPSATHLLGSDSVGRDLLSRLLYGARTTFAVVPLSVGAAFLLGTALGLAGGYAGGWTDALISRVSDVILAFPVLILYVILVTTVGPSLLNVVLAVTLAYAPGVARLVRARTLELRDTDFVRAAVARGEGPGYVMLHEILPNLGSPVVVDLALRTGYTVILVGTLGFLGLGLPPPTPDWGAMVVEGSGLMAIHPHMIIVPAAAIVSVVVACNLIADALGERR